MQEKNFTYSRPKFTDFIKPPLFFLFFTILFHETNLDHFLASYFYSAKLHIWPYRDNYFLEKVFHKGGVLLIIIIFSSFVFQRLLLWKKETSQKIQSYWSYVIVASALTILFVHLLKNTTTISCPWSSVSFEGGLPDRSLLNLFASGIPAGHCFPGGHSSGGFALISLYFGLKYQGIKNKYLLIPGIILGTLFGIIQQIRGAHYFSHDLATVFVTLLSCWMTAWFFYFKEINVLKETKTLLNFKIIEQLKLIRKSNNQ